MVKKGHGGNMLRFRVYRDRVWAWGLAKISGAFREGALGENTGVM